MAFLNLRVSTFLCAVFGGYAIGLLQELSVVVIPSEYKPMIGLIVLVVGLLARPDGLFGEATR
jgi:branched-subunit amino acid ABC-type transport system permease component